MADRFYPTGIPHTDPEVWKSTYEHANEMRSYARSPFPPGTAVHMPGARDSFGYSCPGPIAYRLAKPELALSEEVDLPQPRAHLPKCRVQVDDERETFHTHDAEEMLTNYRSPVARATLTPSSKGGMLSSKGLSKARSLPMLVRPGAPPRMSTPPGPIDRLEDHHFDYFVPKGMQTVGRDKMNTHYMSKLQKSDWHRISFPFSGEGTGFRGAGGLTDVIPPGDYKGQTTSTALAFQQKPIHRHPMNVAGMRSS